MEQDRGEISRILGELQGGDSSAADRLLPLVYEELRALAGGYFASQPHGHTLQPTALVHEAYVKLAANEQFHWKSRAHFMAVAATAMRQILMNHARDKAAAKRGGDRHRVTLDDAAAAGGEHDRQIDLIALDQALSKLEALNGRQAKIVELRYFAGLSISEAAHVVGVGTRTVEEDWRMAKAWLGRQLKATPGA